MPKATHAREARTFTDIPNVGKAMAGDFHTLGFKTPQELAGQDPLTLYKRLCVATSTRQDPCVLDTFLAVVDLSVGGGHHEAPLVAPAPNAPPQAHRRDDGVLAPAALASVAVGV